MQLPKLAAPAVRAIKRQEMNASFRAIQASTCGALRASKMRSQAEKVVCLFQLAVLAATYRENATLFAQNGLR